MNILKRPRRNRKNKAIRSLIQETALSVNDLVAPLFVLDGTDQKVPIDSMPGQFRLSGDLILEEVEHLHKMGVSCVSLFPVLEEESKDPFAKKSCDPDHFYQRVIKDIKNKIPPMMIMTDVALDPYSSDGHDGLVNPQTGEILNDETLEILGQMAITQAESGSDIIGPSDMMDGRVGFIRKALDESGFHNASIMAYTAKYASSLYGPFRDALDSAPKSGDKKTYQMDIHNVQESIREAQLDEEEGADILMVKPGIFYLDVIKTLKEQTTLPVAAYNVSGEYAMIKAAGDKGWLDPQKTMLEMLISMKRAGAQILLTYFAKEVAQIMNKM